MRVGQFSARLLWSVGVLVAVQAVAGTIAEELLQEPEPSSGTAALRAMLSAKRLNNQPDVAASGSQRQTLRARRSAPLALPVAQPAQQFAVDELALARHRLSELITQAHRDKQVERDLLKMLINAKLASSLNHIANPAPGYGARLNWQLMDDRRTDESGGFPLAQLNQLLDEDSEMAGEQVGDDLGPDGYRAGLGKREYIKPCMFNAVSCAKNPFKKY